MRIHDHNHRFPLIHVLIECSYLISTLCCHTQHFKTKVGEHRHIVEKYKPRDHPSCDAFYLLRRLCLCKISSYCDPPCDWLCRDWQRDCAENNTPSAAFLCVVRPSDRA
eukprot:TRINITY_DN269_c0_g2_i2.p1 TRINITY_DN269_c0_g2~~TRINITY_DN269_c0_g2_i2.p1  ORF type:complete len:109 (+),score=3.29 TRINITY_DN269_c0_g2_i2:813-1139(+)